MRVSQITRYSHLAKDWRVDNAHESGLEPFFINEKTGYSSFNPPKGFTAEEIWDFEGAKGNFESVEEIQKLINQSKVKSLDLTGDERFKT